MLKIIGILFLSFSAGCLGILLSQQQKTSAKLSQEVLDLVNFILRNIKYEKKTLYAIYNNYSSALLEKRGFLENLRINADITQSVNQKLSELEKDYRENIILFFEKLGKSPHSKNELELCALYLEIFNEYNQKVQKDSKIKSELYKKLGIIFALMLAIIFI